MGWFGLCHERCPAFPGLVDIPFVSGSPQSWSTTLVVGYCWHWSLVPGSTRFCPLGPVATGGPGLSRHVSAASTGFHLYPVLLQRCEHGVAGSWFFHFAFMLVMAITKPGFAFLPIMAVSGYASLPAKLLQVEHISYPPSTGFALMGAAFSCRYVAFASMATLVECESHSLTGPPVQAAACSELYLQPPSLFFPLFHLPCLFQCSHLSYTDTQMSQICLCV